MQWLSCNIFLKISFSTYKTKQSIPWKAEAAIQYKHDTEFKKITEQINQVIHTVSSYIKQEWHFWSRCVSEHLYNPRVCSEARS